MAEDYPARGGSSPPILPLGEDPLQRLERASQLHVAARAQLAGQPGVEVDQDAHPGSEPADPIDEAHEPGPTVVRVRHPPIRGTKFDEVGFHHPATRTLIATDLVFNIHDAVNGSSSLVFRLLGVLGRTRQSPLWKGATRDRVAAARSCEAVLGRDFERLVPAHGEIVEAGGREALRGGLSWMLAGA